jgi:hypothetical protein
MPFPSNSRLLARIVGLALAICLLVAGTAFAASGHAGNGGGGKKRAKVAHARALGNARCASRRPKRVNTVRRRARCRVTESRPAQPLYWGATVGDQLTGTQAPWDMSAVARFEELSGKSASVVQFFQPFAECNPSCSFYAFPTSPMESIRAHGSIPALSWSSQSIPSSLSEPDFQLSDVVEGRYDEFLNRFATEAREWGHPFFLRFNWEMNGNWFPWSEGVNGNSAGQYVAAWRHVHDIFAAAGATNASWVWCPFVDPAGSLQALGPLYPGDAYVDWTGLDGYNWGTNPSSPRGWRSFDQLFEASYDQITESIAPSKPLMIGEMGASEQGGSKPEWIGETMAQVPVEYPRVKALLWFDKFDDGMDWPVETSTAAAGAFAHGLQNPAYLGASYADLPAAPIQPPS